MKKTIQLIAVAALCLFLAKPVLSQTALKAGDKLPEMALLNIMNPATAGLKTSDFKGKLLILSFWSTNCRASTELLSETAKLEQSFSGDLKIISVGKGTQQRMRGIALERGLSAQTLISEDTLLNTLFPHYLYPQIVWVGPDQTILGITTSEDLNANTIQKILDGKPYAFTSPKSDRMDYDPDKPLFSISNAANTGSLYYSVLSAYSEGLPGGTSIRKDSTTVRINAVNQNRLSLYFLALRLPRYTWPLNRIAYENVSPEKFRTGAHPEERRTKEYCYELSLPEFFADRIHAFMLEDLEKLFGASARVENRMTPVYVLSTIPGKLKLQSSGAKSANNFNKMVPEKKFMINSTLYTLTEYIESISGDLPVIDETNFAGRADLKLSARIHDISSLNMDLAQYGLKIDRVERPIDILVFYPAEEDPKHSQLINQN